MCTITFCSHSLIEALIEAQLNLDSLIVKIR
jgi:hypothetical protein